MLELRILQLLTVSEPPNPAGTISGSSTICTGATTNYSSSGSSCKSGRSDNTSVATVSTSGLVSGIAAGTPNIRCLNKLIIVVLLQLQNKSPFPVRQHRQFTCPKNIADNLITGYKKYCCGRILQPVIQKHSPGS